MAKTIKMRHPKLGGRVIATTESAFRVHEKAGWVKAAENAKVTEVQGVELTDRDTKEAATKKVDADKE